MKLTIPVGHEMDQSTETGVGDFCDVAGTSPDGLDGRCSKLLVSTGDIRLSQNKEIIIPIHTCA